ncbi:RCC1 domain-containing protein [Vibrio sagamiensis]|uniref:Uncharacterized protein n=1 Tax=Vibrio sagamiensis NBRC 104589 TaxID=1219064 RepID=A0A511QK45_9VIBR|nr:hypothetical protein [Vibrio sagamiensis]PNQ54356.1 hypothetical protein C1141_16300 [Vibrio agarivorans]GEM77688.1 hypothetical protein VSA01S_38000 [Vibrio sagamiensis NBRC 104589]
MNKLTFYIFSLTFLFGCGGENSGLPSQDNGGISYIKPEALNVAINGKVAVGHNITGQYTFSDTNSPVRDEATSKYRWLDDNGNELGLTLSLDVDAQLENSEIQFCVTPVAEGTQNTIGDEVCSPKTEIPPVEKFIIPEAQNVLISGSVGVGQNVVGQYTFVDPNTPARAEGVSTFRWLDGLGNQLSSSTSLSIDATLDGKEIQFCVVPVAIGTQNTIGDEVCSPKTEIPPVEKFIIPEALNVLISGSIGVGQNVVGQYTFVDPNSPARTEGVSTFRWLDGLGNQLSSSTSLSIDTSLDGKEIQFCVVPVAIGTENTVGHEACSPKVIVVQQPIITSLSKSDELAASNTITSTSVCNDCDASKTVYKWIVDTNNNGVFGDSITVDDLLVKDREIDGDTITILESEVGTEIQLSAQAFSASGQAFSDVEYNIYKRRFMVDAVGTYGGFWALLNTGKLVRLGYYDDYNHGDLLDINETFTQIGTAWGWYNYAITESGKLIYSGPYISSYGVTGIDADVISVVGNKEAAAALKSTGEVIAFGSKYYGGVIPDAVKPELYDITKIVVADGGAFTALRKDGKVFSWEGENTGILGGINESENNDIKDIFSNNAAFAALKNDGSVVTWGYTKLDYPSIGPGKTGADSSGVDFTGGVKTIVASGFAFAAIKNDDTVVSWGNTIFGGDSSSVDFDGGVTDVVASQISFAALKKNGDVVTWGNVANPAVPITNAKAIYVTKTTTDQDYFAFGNSYAALLNDGTVTAWGAIKDGGDITQRPNNTLVNDNITDIKSGWKTFFALTDEGTKGSWGEQSSNVYNDVENTFASFFQFMTQLKDKTVIVEGGNWWRDAEIRQLDPTDVLLQTSL